MHRFYLPPGQCQGSSLCLTGREAHHGLHVLRLRLGEPIVVLDGVGSQLFCEVAELARDTIRLSLHRRQTIAALPYQLTLLQALPKGKLIDGIIQKATELGAFRVVPLLSERVVTQATQEKLEEKTEHWRTVAIEAIKQCGSAWMPRVEAPVTPKAFLARGEHFDLALIASLETDNRRPRECFESFVRQHGCKPQTICIWVGPEGDFTPAEIAAAKASSAYAVSLGKLVLRCDTAAVYCLSMVNYELGVS
jgi:16S rRNA (uracil1498-N3)-methyltransferase